jgi:Family of unknown function (DUF5681)
MTRANLRPPWPKGVSGNPKGRPPELSAIQDLARTYTEEALEKLVRLMRKGKSETVQLAAALALLDRGHGKPVQALEHAGVGGERLFPRPEELRALTDAQLARLVAVVHEIDEEVAGNGGTPGGPS